MRFRQCAVSRRQSETDHLSSSSDDGIEFPAHKSRLVTACDLFADMFDIANPNIRDSASESPDDILEVPLLECAQAIGFVLPLAYRNGPGNLSGQDYDTLMRCLKFAHRLGMPLVVDCIAHYLFPQYVALSCASDTILSDSGLNSQHRRSYP